MELNSAKESIALRLKSAFKLWLLVSVIAGVVILASHAITSNRLGTCGVTALLKYDGVESGFDPNGNRFDPDDFKNEEAVRLSLEALGQSADAEDIQRVRDALDVQSVVSDAILDNILKNTSLYGAEGEVAELSDVKISAYFPTQYTIKLRCADAGLTTQQGVSFLNELLKAYESYFYRQYGYSASLNQVITSVDYDAYDYIDSVEILSSNLSSLRSYLSELASKDNTRFVSQASGYSFTDLIGMIDTLQAEDIQWITSYITSNNITKDRNLLIDYYQYKIEDAQRALVQQDSRLYTLNGLIDNYVKTTAIFPILRDARSSDETFSTAYEFSQPSAMYDALINEKIACQTNLSSTQEQIALLQRRMERLQAEESSGNPQLVEQRLSAVNEKITRLMEDVGVSSDEFFKTSLLKDAIQVLGQPHVNTITLAGTFKSALPSLLIAESVLFGLYVLSALFAPKRKKAAVKTENAADEAMKEKVSK